MNYRKENVKQTITRLLVVAGYLGAIVAANLIATYYTTLGPHFHPEVTAYTAFGLIAFDFVARDLLHDAWQGRERWMKLGALVVAGSAISWWLNADASRIALASSAAFAVAFIVDTFIYSLDHRSPWLERSNVSNIGAALVDSAVFILIGIPGPFLFVVFFAQVTAKIAGGIVFSLIFQRVRPQTNP